MLTFLNFMDLGSEKISIFGTCHGFIVVLVTIRLKTSYDFIMISRAHSFPRPTECRRIWVFFRGIYGGFRLFSVEFDVFHSNNYFFTENDLKVALLQVCL